MKKGNLSLTGFTLLELIIAIIIIAILAVISFPKFNTMKETSMEREAIANHKLIQAAEKIYEMEEGVYYPHCLTPPCSEDDVANINDRLKLSIPVTGTGGNWNYKIVDADKTAFTAKAKRDNKLKCIDQNDEDPRDDCSAW